MNSTSSVSHSSVTSIRSTLAAGGPRLIACLLGQVPVREQDNRANLAEGAYNWFSAESDVPTATPLTLPPWIGLRVRCSCGFFTSNSVYRIVLDPPDYSKFIRLLFCESPEPNTLNCAVDNVVEAPRHFGNNPLVQSLSLSDRYFEFCLLCTEQASARADVG